ncbi:alpha/beta hydrolase [Allosphingosinicella sp.]|uniref:alpha/beta hydrolase n=1 Tax=Allosphingosinicella sp. TaxID=2823234 RepID=UPI00378478F2
MDWPLKPRAKRSGSLLYINGRSDFIEKYLEVYADFRARGWAVTTFDWRGQGGSRGAGEERLRASFDPFVEDLAALLADWVQATPDPHVAMAHSMGGHLLLRTIIDCKPALDAAIFTAPMFDVNSAPIPARIAPDIADTMYWLGLGKMPMWKVPPGMMVWRAPQPQPHPFARAL